MTQTDGQVTCCIAGGGPAGVMLGFLLARAGVRVAVLEKHADFFRDFRGDTIHPSTLQLMHELGLLDQFLRVRHDEIRDLRVVIGNTEIQMADFSHLPTICKFVALMPQWDFLNFLVEQGKRYAGFGLRMGTEASELIVEQDRVVGLRAKSAAGESEIRADLVVGADGRHSTIRQCAGFEAEDLGAPMDVLWMRLSRRPSDPEQTGGFINFGHMLVTLNRREYWQCAFVIRKGGYGEVRRRGLGAFRNEIARLAPYLADRTGELKDWDDISLLTVAVDRLPTWWRPGLLCIGDAAHTMSPIGGVGVNLAVQDAVAASNILAAPLREGRLTTDHLAQVQRRRTLAMKVIQRMQLTIQNRLIDPLLDRDEPVDAPWPMKLFNAFPVLRRIPARLVGIGVRPEHIHLAPHHLTNS
ncbi:MAG: FAD-dependent oxidoreductase [Alphaproteobacteria bacterium]|nr:FAD-dependent oxidoreductase [Alphaproteobacteria bacterium]MBV9552826.1 FAD-dependent oxidoreductase [Alphaproteobacteria bacterium]